MLLRLPIVWTGSQTDQGGINVKIRWNLILLLGFVLLTAGCGNGGGSVENGGAPVGPGSMAFQLDLNPLTAQPAASAQGIRSATIPLVPTITAATAIVSRASYSTITKNLTVSNNVASGQIDGLAPGYWHVQVDVYENANLIYTGATDINIIAGAVVQCNLLFDPVSQTPTSGSLVITTGLNPMPGYSPVNQAVNDILFDRPNGKLYILDGPAKVIGVYEADTLVRIKDLSLPSAPLSIALDSAGTGIYLGYSSGHIHRIDIASGTETLIADALMEVRKMAVLTSQYLMVIGPSTWDNALKVVNVSNGQIVSTKNVFYVLTDLLYNPLAKTVYSHHTGVSPTDIHYIKIDDAAGTILSEGDSIYHGDYSFGLPLRLINSGTRIATSSGGMFTSAELAANDLRYSGSLGYSYIDLSADDTLGKLFLLNSSGIQKLLIMDQQTYFTDLSVDLAGTPARVFNTAGSVIVFSVKDAKYYAKAFAKADLGL